MESTVSVFPSRFLQVKLVENLWSSSLLALTGTDNTYFSAEPMRTMADDGCLPACLVGDLEIERATEIR